MGRFFRQTFRYFDRKKFSVAGQRSPRCTTHLEIASAPQSPPARTQAEPAELWYE